MHIVLPPDIEARVQRQMTTGKYETEIEVILAGIQLLEQQADPYQGRLPEIQQAARLGWESSQQGDSVDGPTAMAQIRSTLRSRYATPDQP